MCRSKEKSVQAPADSQTQGGTDIIYRQQSTTNKHIVGYGNRSCLQAQGTGYRQQATKPSYVSKSANVRSLDIEKKNDDQKYSEFLRNKAASEKGLLDLSDKFRQ